MTLTKTRLHTAARDKLKAAIETLAERQSQCQAAEAAHHIALRAYRSARNDVEDIEARISGLAHQYRQVHSLGREDIQRRIDDCQEPLRAAKTPLMALGIETERTEKTFKNAEQSLRFYRSQVRSAAEAVVRAEAPSIAEPLIPILQDAVATILAHGPVLLWMDDNGALPRDALGEVPRRVLDLCQSQNGFAGRYRNLVWRHAAAALEADPDATLPSADHL